MYVCICVYVYLYEYGLVYPGTAVVEQDRMGYGMGWMSRIGYAGCWLLVLGMVGRSK